MIFVAGLVLLLVVLAGVIAYAGDRLGTLVGRRRLSLFGTRPRRTGQIVGVLAGVLIMLTTLGVLALAFQNATATLLNAQSTARELVRLRSELNSVTAEIGEYQVQLQRSAQQIELAQQLLRQAEREGDLARAEATAAREEAEELSAQVEEATAELERRNALLVELEERLAEAEELLGAADERRLQAEAARDEALLEQEQAQAEAQELQGRVQGLQEEVAGLAAQAQRLALENQTLQGQSEALREQNRALVARNAELDQASADLQVQNRALEDLNATLRLRILESNERVSSLEADLSVLELLLEDSSRRLDQVQSEFEQVAQGEVTYRRDDLIYSGLIQAADTASAREAVAEFVRSANEVTALRGAGQVRLSADQFDSLVSLVADTAEEVVVVLISPRNQVRSAQLEVSVEAYENTRIVEQGQLLVSHQVHLGTTELRISQSDLRAAVIALVQDTKDRLTRAGLFSSEPPRFTTSEESFVNRLLQLTGPVTIGVTAVEPIDRSGPALLEFLILH